MLWGLFLLIAAVWAVFLIPPLWADRRSSLLDAGRRSALAGSYGSPSRSTYRTTPGTGRGDVGDTTGKRALVRRRRVLVGLTIAVIASLAAIVLIGGMASVAIHVLVDLALILYVSTLRRMAIRRHVTVLAETVHEPADEPLYESRVRVVQSR